MAKVTGGHLSKPLAITVNGKVVAAPVLRGPIKRQRDHYRRQ